MKILFIFILFSIINTAAAMANCENNPHGFDCQLAVLSGDDGAGRVVPRINYPQGTSSWDINLFVRNPGFGLTPPTETLVDSTKPIRTCGVRFKDIENMQIDTKVNGDNIKITMKKFWRKKKRVFKGKISNNMVEIESKNKFTGNPNVVGSVLRCSVFDRVGVEHLACAIFNKLDDGSLLPLGIIGALREGVKPEQCFENPIEARVL